MNKKIAAALLAATVGGGGAAGVLMSHAATAATGDPTTTAPAAGVTPSTAAPTTTPSQRRTERLNTALQGLVDDKTITADQRDAVVKALEAAQPAGSGPRGVGKRGVGSSQAFDAAAKALSTDAATLRTDLAGGKSIADVARAKGVAVDAVVTAIVAAETAQIDQAVTTGKMTQVQADTRKQNLTERVTALVNNTFTGKGAHRGTSTKPAAPSAGTTPTTATTN